MIPPAVFNSISEGLGLAQGLLPCNYRNADASLIYHFGGEGGPSIDVPLKAILDVEAAGQFDDGRDACYLNIIAESDNDVILGDSFMRSGYFVYDLENNVGAMAQGALAVTAEAITAIPSGTTIPGCSSTNTLTLAPSAAATTLPPDSQPTSDGSGANMPG
ncbi:hypothetical protein KHP32_22785, partial [Cronobacter sakazakii]|uniref:pepsin-like aspartyl protease n=1 Tax=Cronobacter sakazakii TaxID=28141 RepID=UPI001BCD71D3